MTTIQRLKGKIAIVTGSSSGIGKAIALRFGQEGASVVVAARRIALCEQTVSQITEQGGEAWAIQADVADERQVERLMADTVAHYGRLDILVNNAGIGGGSRVADTSTEAFDQVMNVNLRGTFFCCRAGFRQMKQQGGGVIINMASVAGVQAWAGTGTYSASKHGIMALTKSLADEGRQYHIKVSAICPGAVADELVDASPTDIERSEKIDPFDVAEAAIYLSTLGKHAVEQFLYIPIVQLARSGGGLNISTLLPLFLVPTMSMIFEKWYPRKFEKEESQTAIPLGPITPLPALEDSPAHALQAGSDCAASLAPGTSKLARPSVPSR